MSKLLFTSSKTPHSIGYIGGGAEHIPLELWPKIPNSDTYQTHLFTLYSDFLPENVFPRRNYYISVFISIEEHALGGVKDSISSKYTVNYQDDLILLNDGFSCAVVYEREQDIGKQDLGSISLVSPSAAFMSVDLPAPLAPIRPTCSPSETENDRSFKIVRSPG